MPESDVLALSRRLVCLGRAELAAVQSRNFLQLDWLTLEVEHLVGELRELADTTRAAPDEVPQLQQLASEFDAVRQQTLLALGAGSGLEQAQLACMQANELQREGRHAEAIVHFERSLQLWPESVDAHNNLGNSLQALGRYDEAIVHYRQALRLAPSLAEAYVNCGNALHAQHRSDEALDLYLQARSLRPQMPEVHSNLGNAYRTLGHIDEAVASYQRALELRPEYVEARANLANALLGLHCYEEALAEYGRAIDLNPTYVVARNNLGIALQELGRLQEALAQHQAALALAPDDARTHQGLATAHLLLGNMSEARHYGRIGYSQPFDVYPHRGSAEPVRVLVLQSAIGGNVVTDRWLDDRLFQKVLLTVDFVEPDMTLPQHDLVLNAIGEADRCQHALAAAAGLLRGRTGPVVNAPERVALTGRVDNARRLSCLPGVVAPRSALLDRALLQARGASQRLAAKGLRWPLLLRSPGFHTGEHFVQVTNAAELHAAARELPGQQLLAIEYLDTRSADGFFRKYRVLLIDGQLYPLHLAVSRNWKVHYFSADMAGSAEHRAEDGAFLADMRAVLGGPAVEALARVRDTLGLDYAGIDFALDAQGRVVIFEANATMVAPPPPAGECWDYRRPAVERANAAVQDMLLVRAGVPR
ncbi:MAG: tetratricopeptide repeat protein [Chloroflexi bacterium]|nr:tetratricopeptide repeat protein [Chloroflexota bacterium]